MKILRFLLIIFFFNPHAQTKELPRIDTKFYLGVYNSFDKLSATAHSIYLPEYSGYNPIILKLTQIEKIWVSFWVMILNLMIF